MKKCPRRRRKYFMFLCLRTAFSKGNQGVWDNGIQKIHRGATWAMTSSGARPPPPIVIARHRTSDPPPPLVWKCGGLRGGVDNLIADITVPHSLLAPVDQQQGAGGYCDSMETSHTCLHTHIYIYLGGLKSAPATFCCFLGGGGM